MYKLKKDFSMKYLFYFLFVLNLAFIPTLAQDEENSSTEGTSEAEHSNELGLFLGGTSFTGLGSWSAFTAAIEYERYFGETPLVYVGLSGEYVSGDHSEFLVGVPLGVEMSHFKLYIAPTIVFEKEKAVVLPDENLKESTTKFFIRLGTGYKFTFNNFSLTPNVALDIISSNTYVVYGVTMGFGF